MDDEGDDDIQRRLLDDPTISPALRLALMERGRGGPPATVRSSIASGIDGLLTNGSGRAPSRRFSPFQWRIIVLGTLTIGLAVGAAVWVFGSLVPSRRERPVDTSPALATGESQRTDAAIVAPVAVPQVREVMEVMSLRDAGPSSSGGARTPLRERNRVQRTRTDSSDRVEEEDEISLITRAEGALRASSPREALRLLTEHRQRFSRGILVEEREVLAMDALGRLNRWDEAEARAARFLETYPRSALVPRVRELMHRNDDL